MDLYNNAGSSVISHTSCQNVDQTTQPCDHEEADTRIALHLFSAVRSGARNLLVRTVDSDVIVILVGLFSHFHQDTNIWVAFGTGKFFRYYLHQCHLPSSRSSEILFFHAFTGCDTTSQFLGKGKKSAWDAWKAYPEATAAFVSIVDQPFQPMTVTSPSFTILNVLPVYYMIKAVYSPV